jgi:hypothetical protein
MRPDDVESARARIARVLTQELRLLSRRDAPRQALKPMTLAGATDSVTQVPVVAVVAADAGNVELRLHPLRIGFVRAATSDPKGLRFESFVPLSYDLDRQLQFVFGDSGG